MILQATGGGSAGGSTGGSGGQNPLAEKVRAVSALPETVEFNKILIITELQPTNIFFAYDEPFDAQTGDIWIHTVDGGKYDFFIGGITLTLGVVSQYDGSGWVYRDAYIGRFDAWQLFSTNTSLEALSWSQIMAIVNSGEDPSKFFAVGDTKDIVLANGEIITMAIGAFKHNTISGTADKAAIAWTATTLFNTKYPMADTSANNDGWKNCQMREETLPVLFELFPAELKAAMKYVDVITSRGNENSTLVTTSDRLRLHSVTELGLTSSTYAVEGVAYPYYDSADKRVKTLDGAAAIYWTRSPALSGSTTYGRISANGAAGASTATTANCVAVCFDT